MVGGKLADNSTTFESLRAKLESYEQQHLLRFWDDLDSRQRDLLRAQIEDLDLDQLQTLIAGHDTEQDFAAIAASASSPPAVRADGSGANWTLEEAHARGQQALQAGEVGAVIVAGGQGTRLGFDQPKGMFPVGPVSQRTLFQFFADRLVATGDRYGARIPLYVMTSDATDAATRRVL